MPFGRHRGKPIDQLPDGYIDWLLGLELRPPLRDWVIEEATVREELEEERYQARVRAARAEGSVEGKSLRTPSASVPTDLERAVRDIVKRGYRACAVAYHPDHGGTVEKMQSINSAKEWLKNNLGVE
jgi:hypothetical protein